MKACQFKNDVCTTPYACSITVMACVFNRKPNYSIVWIREMPDFTRITGYAIMYKGICVAINNGKTLTKLI